MATELLKYILSTWVFMHMDRWHQTSVLGTTEIIMTTIYEIILPIFNKTMRNGQKQHFRSKDYAACFFSHSEFSGGGVMIML